MSYDSIGLNLSGGHGEEDADSLGFFEGLE